jgi:hypothetical protein
MVLPKRTKFPDTTIRLRLTESERLKLKIKTLRHKLTVVELVEKYIRNYIADVADDDICP